MTYLILALAVVLGAARADACIESFGASEHSDPRMQAAAAQIADALCTLDTQKVRFATKIVVVIEKGLDEVLDIKVEVHRPGMERVTDKLLKLAAEAYGTHAGHKQGRVRVVFYTVRVDHGPRPAWRVYDVGADGKAVLRGK